MAQQRGPGRDVGGGRERGTTSSERGRRALGDQEREQHDLHRRGGGDTDEIGRRLREKRDRETRAREEGSA